MRRFTHWPALLATAALAFPTALWASPSGEARTSELKEWTILVFLNGHNNLDRFGAEDINEMETVGSTDQINVVVQWASLANRETRRLYVTQDSDPNVVNSTVLSRTSPVDMGDWRNLVEFIKWGAANYPAKRYFVDVWDHGSGWHKLRGEMNIRDISWDDNTGNSITTEQLGDAIREASAAIGQKIDVYGSDACLMSMAEVANEMSDSVNVFLGSEEVEPGEGWPYGDFLAKLAPNPTASAAQLGRYLTDAYVASYQGGSQGSREITFSVLDLTKTDVLNDAVRGFGTRLRTLGATDRRKAVTAANNAMSFTYSDYVDIVDFLDQLDRSGVSEVARGESNRALRDAIGQYVVYNKGSTSYAKAHGVAFWAPSSKYTYNSYATRYRGLEFHKATQWGDALQHILQDLQ